MNEDIFEGERVEGGRIAGTSAGCSSITRRSIRELNCYEQPAIGVFEPAYSSNRESRPQTVAFATSHFPFEYTA